MNGVHVQLMWWEEVHHPSQHQLERPLTKKKVVYLPARPHSQPSRNTVLFHGIVGWCYPLSYATSPVCRQVAYFPLLPRTNVFRALATTKQCSAAMTQGGGFVGVVQSAAAAAGRTITLLKTVGPAADHVTNPCYPEGAYLTGAFFYVV